MGIAYFGPNWMAAFQVSNLGFNKVAQGQTYGAGVFALPTASLNSPPEFLLQHFSQYRRTPFRVILNRCRANVPLRLKAALDRLVGHSRLLGAPVGRHHPWLRERQQIRDRLNGLQHRGL